MIRLILFCLQSYFAENLISTGCHPLKMEIQGCEWKQHSPRPTVKAFTQPQVSGKILQDLKDIRRGSRSPEVGNPNSCTDQHLLHLSGTNQRLFCDI